MMEAEYVVLSMSLSEAIPMMGLLKEVHTFSIKVSNIALQILCKVFKDNSGALEMACQLKIHPCTKHINQYFQHFHKYVQCCNITFYGMLTTSQHADMLMKPLLAEPFQMHRKSILGW